MIQNLSKKLLLGGFKNRPVWVGIEIRNCNGYPELAISFAEGEAFCVEDYTQDYYEYYFNELFDTVDDSQKLRYLENGGITRKDWIKKAINEIYDYRDVAECSCTDFEIELGGKTYNFLTTCGGQHDVRNDGDFENFKHVNEDASKIIFELWDSFHLKKIDEKIYNKILNAIELLGKINEEDFIKNLIEI